MERWCIVGLEGQKLPEPLGDTEAEVIEAFCALSEMHPDGFAIYGYTTAKILIPN